LKSTGNSHGAVVVVSIKLLGSSMGNRRKQDSHQNPGENISLVMHPNAKQRYRLTPSFSAGFYRDSNPHTVFQKGLGVGLIPILERKPTDSQPVTWVKDRLANPKSLSFRAKSKIENWYHHVPLCDAI
jgi:hypothetical protein